MSKHEGKIITITDFLTVVLYKKMIHVHITGVILPLHTDKVGESLSKLRSCLHDNPKFPVYTHITSVGGHNDTSDILVNILLHHKGKIHTIGVSKVMSAAAPIFMTGVTRTIYEGTRYMLHVCSYSSKFKTSADIKLTADRLYKETVRGFKQGYINPGFLDKKYLKKFKAGHDIYLTAEQVYKQGIATHYISNSGVVKTKHKGGSK